MRRVLFYLLLLLTHAACAQQGVPGVYKGSPADTQRVAQLNDLAATLSGKKSAEDLALAQNYATEALSLSQQLSYDKGTATALFNLGNIIQKRDDKQKQEKALHYFQSALSYFKRAGMASRVPVCMHSIGFCYHHMGALDKAIQYEDSAKNLFLQLKDTVNFINRLAFVGHCYFDMGNYRAAYALGMEAWKQAQKTNDTALKVTALSHLSNLFFGAGIPYTALDYYRRTIAYVPTLFQHKPIVQPSMIWSLIIAGKAFVDLGQTDSAAVLATYLPVDNTDSDYNLFLGYLHALQHKYQEALACFKKGLLLDTKKGLKISCSRYANEIGRTYLVLHQFDSARFYAAQALTIAEQGNALLEKRNAVGTLSDIYVQTKNYEKVYAFSHWYKTLNDSLAPEEYKQKLALVQIENELESQKQQAQLLVQQNRIKEQQLGKELLVKKFLAGGVVALLLFGGFAVRNNRHKQRTNLLLQQQKDEVQRTLSELKATQQQLIQSEKMASLGEMTAGIAHEIQNPLNFINNFSEVSTELIGELHEELEAGHTSEVRALAVDIAGNLQKIVHHGKRADSIVKGMLQHSRVSSGQKEPTDINALADEYLHLSYHGLRAKDKLFNAAFETHFDQSIGKINVASQDLGRVLLNLYNNAFYAVNEKKKQAPGPYEPRVEVTTRRLDKNVVITVKDNGTGIPQKVLDKIYQPFFTTKPTGQGTGLGLSMSYEIISKTHGGTIDVKSEEGQYAEFTISLPV